ncbi:MAG TPA: hypothetical protein VGV93_04025 [Acidimicrobiales bacterium]|nr:hypothetical protein [Acidimicrobiales bacterium]
MSVPGGDGGEGRCDWDLAVAGVRHAAARGLTLRAAVRAVAAQVGVSERTLWRWLARSEAAAPKAPWRPSQDDLVVYARWCANASAAWRERCCDGAPVPSLRTFQEGIAAALTPGQRAGLRAGKRAQREFDAYLRCWVKSAGTHQVVPAQGRPLLRAWLRTQGESRSRPWGAPPRPTDERSRQLWRTPPPTHVRPRCEPIDCRPFRRIAEPPMSWTRPPPAQPTAQWTPTKRFDGLISAPKRCAGASAHARRWTPMPCGSARLRCSRPRPP